MEEFLSVSGETVTEKVIEKSRFITTSRYVDGEEAAKSFVASIKKKYPDATHNCYAYICDAAGNFMRFSDDGEPQGTAGMPMLEVLKNRKIKKTAAVVTRYFGGIKLGAGGLVRAYSGCVSENLSAAEIVTYTPCSRAAYAVGYSFAESLLKFCERSACRILKTEYSDGVTVEAEIKLSEKSAFDSALKERLCGKVSITELGEYLSPFKV